MALVCFAESRHPELEQPDVVLLAGARGPQEGQDLLGVLPPSPVHFGELEEHFDLAEREKNARALRGKRTGGTRRRSPGSDLLHPLLLQTQQAVGHHVHGQILIGQSHLEFVQ